MQSLPEGSMLSIRADSKRVESLLPPTVQMAAENGPAACVVSGPTPDIDALAEELTRRELGARKLRTSHAFHSSMMDPVVSPFAAAVRGVSLQAPKIRMISTVTGQPLTDAEAQDPMYWALHLRRTVRFSPAVQSALGEGRVFLEAGPRTTLTSLTRQHGAGGIPPVAIASLADGVAVEIESLAAARAELWSVGVELATSTPVAGRRRVRLPTYPFERQRHWVDPVPSEQRMTSTASSIPHPSTTLASSSMITPQIDRKERLAARVRELMEDVSGVEISPEQNGASFIEQGLDSLTLTQVALQLKKTFGLNVTFRNLMETYRSVDDLVAHLDEKLPPDAAPAEVAAPVAPPAAAAPMAAPMMPAPGLVYAGPALGGSLQVQQLIQQQMSLMAQQLALLGGASVAAPAAVAPVPTSVPVIPPAAASASKAPAAPMQAAPPASQSGDDEKPEAMKQYDVKKAFGAIARIHTTGTELTERQRKRLDQFMARYIERTKKSKAYTVEHRPHLADPRVVNGFRPQIKEIIYQIVIERSKGSHMWDLDGNEYVDALNGFGMSLFGWQPDFILEAVRRQLDSGYDIGPQHPLAGEVAKLFCEVTNNDRAALCNTGSEAVMGCVRIARTVTGRSKIAIFSGAYHGIFDEVIVRGTKKLKSIPAAPGIMPNTSENVVVLDYGTPETLKYLQEHAEELAAILVEPVQSRRPDFQPKEFLKQLRTLTEKSGTLLVFDEVVTGFRCHPGGIQALFDIRADLASYGKVVGGGFPIGVIAGKREYMDALDGGHWEYGDASIPTVGVTYFAGTFVRHPLALVAAKAVLEHVKRHGPQLQAALTQRTTEMVEELSAFCQEVGAPIVLKSFSSVWKTFFTEDHPLQDLLFAMMRSRGIHILDNFPCFFTTAHTPADFAAIKKAFKESVLELQEADFIPKRATSAADLFDASRPPVQGARLGRDADGKPAWFVANSQTPGKYVRVEAK
jgi:glutamate-1-semialdehyde aminotransferase/acyl carrier protein